MRRTKIPHRRTRALLTIFALSAIGTLVLLAFGCGIESYPYLFPAERIAGEVGFRHDNDNDPNIFQGYELYYRIYRESSVSSNGSVDKSRITDDMSSYFNGSDDFFSVSFDDMGETSISSSEDRGYRRFYIDSRKSSLPLIPISSSDADTSFNVILNKYSNRIEVEVPGTTYTLKRNTHKSSGDDYPDFNSNESNYAVSDNDILFDPIPGGAESIIVAVFVVPYGFNNDDFTTILANGSSSDMTYIGFFELNL